MNEFNELKEELENMIHNGQIRRNMDLHIACTVDVKDLDKTQCVITGEVIEHPLLCLNVLLAALATQYHIMVNEHGFTGLTLQEFIDRQLAFAYMMPMKTTITRPVSE